jgi:hypothetical protein
MISDALFLFLILLLGLVFCSVLGGNCGVEGFADRASNQQREKRNKHDYNSATNGAATSSNVVYDNYNHYSGSSTQLANGTTFYGKNGGYVVVTSNTDGSQGLKVMVSSGNPVIMFSSQNMSSNDMNNSGNNGSSSTFYGPSGETATVMTGPNGKQSIQIHTAYGTYEYTYGYGHSDTSPSLSNLNGSDITSSQYYGSTGSPIQTGDDSLAYQGSGMSSQNTYDYSSSLPPGIPASQIPRGQEDMYILKSEVIPPVCPACPAAAACPRQESCPPCPACARCPEPSFECKKVPNYNAIDNDYLPAPVLSDFSSFGM